MHLTRFTDNALRCLLHLGVTPERRSTIGEVAASMAMSEDHLTKVVQRLAQRGYVQTIRGRKGGVRLAKLPADIVVGAVVRDTEQDCSLVPCFRDPAACPISAFCQLAPVLSDALAAFLHVLDGKTLGDLLAEQQQMRCVPT